MIREVDYNGTIIKYELIRKRVKNINLRIKPDLSVIVSANTRVSVKYIDDFVLKKGDFILSAIEDYKTKTEIVNIPKFTAEEFSAFIAEQFEIVYNYFKAYNIDKPTLKMRKMKSRWGSCNYVNCVITLSTNLIYCTKEQIYYVIVHEFSHLLVPNHSKDFYAVVEKYCKDYKRIRKEMNNIILR